MPVNLAQAGSTPKFSRSSFTGTDATRLRPRKWPFKEETRFAVSFDVLAFAVEASFRQNSPHGPILTSIVGTGSAELRRLPGIVLAVVDPAVVLQSFQMSDNFGACAEFLR
jgi:hypothetical protein